MARLIDKSALVAEIEKRRNFDKELKLYSRVDECNGILYFINTLEVKESAPTAHVVTRCEEHSDYVEEVFFDKDKAQEYCDQFKGNENEYARYITKVKVTL